MSLPEDDDRTSLLVERISESYTDPLSQPDGDIERDSLDRINLEQFDIIEEETLLQETPNWLLPFQKRGLSPLTLFTLKIVYYALLTLGSLLLSLIVHGAIFALWFGIFYLAHILFWANPWSTNDKVPGFPVIAIMWVLYGGVVTLFGVGFVGFGPSKGLGWIISRVVTAVFVLGYVLLVISGMIEGFTTNFFGLHKAVSEHGGKQLQQDKWWEENY
jgi:hypothetical protein